MVVVSAVWHQHKEAKIKAGSLGKVIAARAALFLKIDVKAGEAKDVIQAAMAKRMENKENVNVGAQTKSMPLKVVSQPQVAQVILANQEPRETIICGQYYLTSMWVRDRTVIPM